MTLRRSRGEPKKATNRALTANRRMLLKAPCSLLHALCQNAQAHCLALEGSLLDRSHA
jgi:hypothetical protein